jgi:hypothetical protein
MPELQTFRDGESYDVTLAHEIAIMPTLGLSRVDPRTISSGARAAHNVGIIRASPERRATHRLPIWSGETATGWVFAIAFSFNWISAWTYICVLSKDS